MSAGRLSCTLLNFLSSHWKSRSLRPHRPLLAAGHSQRVIEKPTLKVLTLSARPITSGVLNPTGELIHRAKVWRTPPGVRSLPSEPRSMFRLRCRPKWRRGCRLFSCLNGKASPAGRHPVCRKETTPASDAVVQRALQIGGSCPLNGDPVSRSRRRRLGLALARRLAALCLQTRRHCGQFFMVEFKAAGLQQRPHLDSDGFGQGIGCGGWGVSLRSQ